MKVNSCKIHFSHLLWGVWLEEYKEFEKVDKNFSLSLVHETKCTQKSTDVTVLTTLVSIIDYLKGINFCFKKISGRKIF